MSERLEDGPHKTQAMHGHSRPNGPNVGEGGDEGATWKPKMVSPLEWRERMRHTDCLSPGEHAHERPGK